MCCLHVRLSVYLSVMAGNARERRLEKDARGGRRAGYLIQLAVLYLMTRAILAAPVLCGGFNVAVVAGVLVMEKEVGRGVVERRRKTSGAASSSSHIRIINRTGSWWVFGNRRTASGPIARLWVCCTSVVAWVAASSATLVQLYSLTFIPQGVEPREAPCVPGHEGLAFVGVL